MHWISLPQARKDIPLAFHDEATAKRWLASLPQTQAMQMLTLLGEQIEAVAAAPLAPQLALTLLNILRTAALPALQAIEPRYGRKPLPMPADDVRCFDLAQHLLLHLGCAYLGLAPHFAPADKSLPLNRAACAFRIGQYGHFLAARECPLLWDQLLFATLTQAESHDLLRQGLDDPDFPHLGAANIGGHLAWAFMLRLIDPYQLSSAELVVANRAVSRWRELTSFQTMPDDDVNDHSVDLQPLFGGALPAGIPRWLNVRKVTRKIAQRIAALEAGEAPDSLKLGRELSTTGCLRLLRRLESSLEFNLPQPSTAVGEIELAFGPENAFAVFTGEMPTPVGSLDSSSASLSHQRLEMFGFDRVSSMPNAVKKLNVPSETWSMIDGKAMRPAERQGNRRQAPCLIAATLMGKPRLGVMLGLQSRSAGGLQAELSWYEPGVAAGRLGHGSPSGQRLSNTPVFLMNGEQHYSLIVPASAGVRLTTPITLLGLPVNHVTPTEVLERGVDFVRYAISVQ